MVFGCILFSCQNFSLQKLSINLFADADDTPIMTWEYSVFEIIHQLRGTYVAAEKIPFTCNVSHR